MSWPRLPQASDRSKSLQETSQRFEEWCGSLGAHLIGDLSLEERLRDASKVKELILNCLDGVEEALEQLQAEAMQYSQQCNAPHSIFPSCYARPKRPMLC